MKLNNNNKSKKALDQVFLNFAIIGTLAEKGMPFTTCLDYISPTGEEILDGFFWELKKAFDTNDFTQSMSTLKNLSQHDYVELVIPLSYLEYFVKFDTGILTRFSEVSILYAVVKSIQNGDSVAESTKSYVRSLLFFPLQHPCTVFLESIDKELVHPEKGTDTIAESPLVGIQEDKNYILGAHLHTVLDEMGFAMGEENLATEVAKQTSKHKKLLNL